MLFVRLSVIELPHSHRTKARNHEVGLIGSIVYCQLIDLGATDVLITLTSLI